MSRIIDLRGPEGNVFGIAGLAQSWNRQIGNNRKNILDETTTRLGGKAGMYEDVLDTFDIWFKDVIRYRFINDPRNPNEELDDE